MRPVTTAAISSATSSSPVVLDYRAENIAVTLAVTLSSGAVLTYSVQYTTDDVFSSSFNASTANWTDVSTMSGLTASSTASLVTPVTAVRLKVTAYTSGSATLKVISTSGVGA